MCVCGWVGMGVSGCVVPCVCRVVMSESVEDEEAPDDG